METLKTTLSVIYADTDITAEINADLLSFSYTDCADDEADEVSITLKDPDGNGAGAWAPERGAKLNAMLFTESRGMLNTGMMSVDRMSVSGSPRVFALQAVSIPLDNTIRRTIKNRNFEGLTLQAVAGQIAGEAGLTLLFDSQIDPEYDRIDQRQESDLAFLKRLGDEAGVSVKVSDTQLILFDQASYESKEPVKLLTLGTSPVLSWNFEMQQSERYRACTVKWRDIRQKTTPDSASQAKASARTAAPAPAAEDSDKVDIYGTNFQDKAGTKTKGAVKQKAEYIEATFVDESVDETGQTYVLKKRCTSYAEAERLAKAKLRRLNLRQTTGSLTVIGDPELAAGSVIALQGFGGMDGSFIIERAVHSMSEQGYRTELSLRKVNQTY